MSTKLIKGPEFKPKNKPKQISKREKIAKKFGKQVLSKKNSLKPIVQINLEELFLKYHDLLPKVVFKEKGDDPPPDVQRVKVPDNIKKTVTEISDALFTKYGDNYDEYSYNIAKLTSFLDPDHFIGQFAKLFQEKAFQNVYEPSRLVALDITDMLPEVFLNPNIDDAEKLSIYQSISRSLRNISKELVLDPAVGRKQRPIAHALEKPVTDLIDKNKVDVKDLCENPYWKMKKVNMIICKDSGKFYCLDIERLLEELADAGTATNYFTKTPLPDDIVQNLSQRYSAEIAEIKDTGDVPDIGVRNSPEKLDLRKTLDSLIEFQEVFNSSKMQNAVGVFGLDSIEEEKYGGKKGLLKSIPPMTLREFQQWEDELDNDDFVVKVSSWLMKNIRELNDIVNVEKPVEKSPVQRPHKSPAENKLVKTKILAPGTIAHRIYNNYIQRLETLSETVVKELERTREKTRRGELNAQLLEINKLLRELRNKGRTIGGIITILQSALEKNNAVLAEKAVGIDRLYPSQRLIIESQRKAIREYIGKIEEEIEYLRSVKDNLEEVERPELIETPPALKPPPLKPIPQKTVAQPVKQQAVYEDDEEVADFLSGLKRDPVDRPKKEPEYIVAPYLAKKHKSEEQYLSQFDFTGYEPPPVKRSEIRKWFGPKKDGGLKMPEIRKKLQHHGIRHYGLGKAELLKHALVWAENDDEEE